MNRIYKVVWCHVRNTYVVASELASRKKIKSVSGDGLVLGKSSLAVFMASVLYFSMGQALGVTLGSNTNAHGSSVALGAMAQAVNEASVAIGQSAIAKEKQSVAIGASAEALGLRSTAVGDHAEAWKQGSLALGNSAKAKAYRSIALGVLSEAAQQNSIVLGNNGKALGEGSIAIGNDSESKGNFSVVLGSNAQAGGISSVAVGSLSKATGSNAVAMGSNAVASGDQGAAVGNLSKAIGAYSSAFGTNAKADGKSGVAIGASSKSWGESSTAVGNHANGHGYRSSSYGYNSQATGKNSVAIGSSAIASGEQGVAVGNLSGATGNYSAAFGTNAKSGGQQSVAIGAESTSGGLYSIALGMKANAIGQDGIAIGRGTNAQGPGSVVLGLSSKATGNDSIAMGLSAQSDGRNAIALGKKAIANGANALSMGADANASAEWATALGVDAKALNTRATALGADAQSGGLQATAVGNASRATKDYTAAFGTNAHATGKAAIAVGSMSRAEAESATAVGDNAKATAIQSSSYGYNANASGGNSVATGSSSVASGTQGVAVGHGSTASGEHSTALGGGATASNTQGTAVGYVSKAEGQYSAAFGTNATATKVGTVAVGNSSKATADRATAVGDNANATGAQSSAHGYKATASAEYAAAFGTHAVATGKGAIAVGSSSDALAEKATAVGDNAKATGIQSSSYGYKATASNEFAAAFGTNATAEGKSTTSIGASSKAIGNFSTAIGTESEAKGLQGTAMGSSSKATGDYSAVYGTNATATGLHGIAVGNNSKSEEDYSLAMGTNAKALSKNAVAIGASSDVTGIDGAAFGRGAEVSGRSGLALGYGAKSSGDGTVAIGAGSQVTGQNEVSFGHTGLTRKLTYVTDGAVNAESTDAINGSQLWMVEQKIDNLSSSGDSLVILNGNKTQAVLNPNLVAGTDSIGLVLGAGASATYINYNNGGVVTEATDSIVLGNRALASTHNGNIAIGADSESIGEKSLAIGEESKSTGFQTISVGLHTEASGDNAVSIGHSTIASGSHSFALGIGALAEGTDSTAMGNEAKATATNSMALGNQAQASGHGSYALGSWAKAAADHSTALGPSAEASGDQGSAVGNNSQALGEFSAAFGTNAIAEGKSTTSVGASSKASGDFSTAVGVSSEAAGLQGSAIGNSSKAIGDYSAVFGTNATAEGQQGVALGNKSASEGDYSAALGTNAKALGSSSVAIGAQAKALGNHSYATGSNSLAQGEGSTAIGDNAQAMALNSIAIGRDSKSSAHNSLAFGQGAEVLDGADGGLALGSLTKVTAAGSVAIGHGSQTKYSESYIQVGENEFVAQHEIVTYLEKPENQASYDEFVSKHGQVFVSEVSFGNETVGPDGNPALFLRKLTGVADGLISEESTEAINGSQLYATNQAISNALGDSSVLNADGTIGAPDYNAALGTTGKDLDSVEKAFEYIGGEVSQGLNFAGNTGAVVNKKLGETLNIKGGLADTADATADNLRVDVEDGNLVVKMASKINGLNDIQVGEAGKDGKDGVDGIIGVNGKDGSSVVLNGKDGSIGLTGPKGETGEAGKTTISVINNGQQGLDGEPGKDGEVRVVYTDKNGDQQQVANLNDGLQFTADNGVVVNRKLNEKLEVKGGATAATTAKNIVTTADENGSIQIDLAKDVKLGADGSLAIGNTMVHNDGLTINNGPSITTGGIDAGNTVISNVADGSDANDAVNKGQLDKATEDLAAVTDKGLSFAGNTGAVVNKKLGETLNIKGGLADTADATADNLRVDVDANGDLIVKMASNITGLNDIQVGEAGKDGEDGVDGIIGVNGKDGSSVVLNGKDGSIGLTGPAGKDGQANTVISVINNGQQGLDGEPGKDGEVRVVYTDKNGDQQQVANLNDGLQFTADNGVVVNRKLNEKLEVKGGATAATTAKNIVTTADENGSIQIDLAKDVKLGADGSLAIGNTMVHNGGLTINNGPSITTGGIDAGNTVISNVADGSDANDAVNKGQLDKATEDLAAVTDKGLSFAGNTGAVVNKKLGETLNIKGGLADTADATADNLRVDVDANGDLIVKMASNITGLNDIQVGEAGKDGKDGVDGTIGVNGKDGSSVVLNGKDGSIGLTGPAGKDGEAGKTVISVINNGQQGLDGEPGKDGEVRVVYTDKNGDQQQVANLNDGLQFTADNGVVVNRKLNEKLEVKGGATAATTAKNIVTTADENGSIQIDLAKDVKLGADGSLAIGDTTVNNDGLTINNGPSITTGGIDAGNTVISNVADGSDANDAVNKGQLDKATEDLAAVTDKGLSFAGNTGAVVNKKLGETLNIKGGLADTADATADNLRVDVDANGDLIVKMASNITGLNDIQVGEAGKDGKDGVDGTIGVNGKDGSSVALNGKDGSIGLTGPAGKDGTPGITTTIKVVQDGKPGVDGKGGADGEAGITRVVYEDRDGTQQEVANLNDGMKFAGNNGSVSKKLNETVTIKGGLADDAVATADNLRVDVEDGNLVVKMSSNIKGLNDIQVGEAGKDGKDGVDGIIGVNGKDGSSVVLNGKDGSIGLTGPKGETGEAGKTIISVTSNGKQGLDGEPGKDGEVRVVYTDKNGDQQQVANLNDGLQFTADNGVVVNRKLNEKLEVKGGATAVEATAKNIVTSADATGSVQINLAKDIDLGDKGSLAIGNTTVNSGGLTINNGPSITTGGIDAGNTVISNVADGSDANDAVNKGQLDKATEDLAAVTDKGLSFAGNTGAVVNKKLGETLNIKGGLADTADATADNLRVDVDANGDLIVKMASNITGLNDIQVGEAGKDGEDGVDGIIGVNGKDGSSVVLNGKDGSIGLTGPAGKDGEAGKTVISVINNGQQGLDGEPGKDGEVRVVYTDKNGDQQQVANLNDGLQFTADNGVVVNRKLNEQLEVKGGATAATTAKNIVTTADENGSIQIDLAKDVKLGADGSLAIGNTMVHNDGLTINNGPSITTGGIDAGNTVISNVADGSDANDAVNKGQLDKATEDLAAVTDKGLSFAGNTGAVVNKKLGETLNIKGGLADTADATADNLRVDVDANGDLIVKMASNITGLNDIQVGEAGKDGEDGVDGIIGVNGKDGSSVVLNGKDGSIGLTGKDGVTTTISVTQNGKAGVDGKDGVTRIVYGDQEVANLNDGLKFAADNGDVIERKLNQELRVTGVKAPLDPNNPVALKEAADADNIVTTARADGSILINLAKDIDLGDKGSLAIGNTTVNSGGLTIKNGPSITTGGINAGNKVVSNVADGSVDASSKDAINGSQLYTANKNIADTLGDAVTINADTGAIEGAEFLAGRETPKLDAEGKPMVDANGKPVMETVKGFATVTDAFNSLGAADQALVDALGGGATVNVDGSITGPTYVVNKDKDGKGNTYHNVGEAISNVDGRVTDNTKNITDITNNITSGKAGLVQLSDDQKTIVIDNNAAKDAETFDFTRRVAKVDAKGEVVKDNEGNVIYDVVADRTLTGVAVGKISETSSEAINGAQLHAIGTSLAKHLDSDATFNERDGVFEGFNYTDNLGSQNNVTTVSGAFDAIRKGEAGLLQMKDGKLVFSDVAKKATTFDVSGDADSMTITGVKSGIADADAVNVSQLKGVTKALGGDAGINADGSIKAPTYTFIDKDDNGKNIVFNDVGSALENLDGRVVKNTGDINTINQNINNINTGKAGLVMIDGDRIVFDSSIAGGRTFDISNNGQARKMTGVADGNIAAGSKDAVNAGQLHDTNQNVAKNTNNIGSLVDSLGGGAGIDKNGKHTGPNYLFTDGSNHTNVGSALDNLDGRVNDLDTKVDGITNGTEGLVKLSEDGKSLVIDNDLAKDAGKFDISNDDEDRTLTGVADGNIAKDSNDAINGSQLHGSNKSIASIFGDGATIDKNGYVTVPGGFDVGQLENGDFSVGGALDHLSNKITSGEGGMFTLDRDNNQIILADNKDINKDTVVNMGDRKIVGVANGKVEKDSLEAVNGGQLWETNQNVTSNTNQIKHINNTMKHYNTRINNLEKTVHENRKRASAGTASAMAMSSIPYLDYAKYSFGMGVASYDGEAAMSMGLEFRMGDNGRFRIQGSYDTQNKAGVGVGMAFEL